MLLWLCISSVEQRNDTRLLLCEVTTAKSSGNSTTLLQDHAHKMDLCLPIQSPEPQIRATLWSKRHISSILTCTKMCREEKIPSANWTQRVFDSLEVVGDSTIDARDIYSLASTHTGTSDEIVDGHNSLINTTDAETIYLQNLNGAHVSMDDKVEEDYENVFNIPFLSRRSERPIWRSYDGQDLVDLPPDAIAIMHEWALL